jgi:hypothetical protein
MRIDEHKEPECHFRQDYLDILSRANPQRQPDCMKKLRSREDRCHEGFHAL